MWVHTNYDDHREVERMSTDQKDEYRSVKSLVPHYPDMPPGHKDDWYFDDLSFAIYGKVDTPEGEKLLYIIAAIYKCGGRNWGIEDDVSAFNQTSITFAGINDREMTDNNYICNRCDPVRRFKNFEVIEDGDSVTWICGDRTIVCRQDSYEITGEHLGVDFDFRITDLSEPVIIHGPWPQARTVGVAGNEQMCHRCEGSFTWEGKKYTLKEGTAVRERTLLSRGPKGIRDIATIIAQGYLWGWALSEELTVFVFLQGATGDFAGTVFLKDRRMDFPAGQTTVRQTKFWEDPQVKSRFTTCLDVTMESEEGKLELVMDTWARYLSGFHYVTAYTTHHGAVGLATGRFTLPGGKVIEMAENSEAYFEQGFSTPLPAG